PVVKSAPTGFTIRKFALMVGIAILSPEIMLIFLPMFPTAFFPDPDVLLAQYRPISHRQKSNAAGHLVNPSRNSTSPQFIRLRAERARSLDRRTENPQIGFPAFGLRRPDRFLIRFFRFLVLHQPSSSDVAAFT